GGRGAARSARARGARDRAHPEVADRARAPIRRAPAGGEPGRRRGLAPARRAADPAAGPEAGGRDAPRVSVADLARGGGRAPGAVVMFSAEDIFGAPRAGGGGRAVAGTRGSVDDGPSRGDGRQSGGTILGLPAPRLLTATLGITPEPFSNADFTFSEESEAARWEAAWPDLRQKLRSNPLVVLTGFSGLLGRIALEREGAVLHVHI